MSVDFEMIKPLFDMYKNAIPLAKARSKYYFGHDYAYFPETITFWGTSESWRSFLLTGKTM